MKLQKETTGHGKWYDDACGAAFAMELIGERWSLLVLRELMLGPLRFSDIRARLPGISAKVLAERLERLEEVGIVVRERLAPPVSTQVYALTQWGLALEPVMQELGRWAVRSPLHDATLPMTAVSLMLSMRTMLDRERARGLSLAARFEVGDEGFRAQLRDGELTIARAGDDEAAPDLVFSGPNASAFLPVIYGKLPICAPESQLRLHGDADLAARFIDVFSLPPKCTGTVGEGR